MARASSRSRVFLCDRVANATQSTRMLAPTAATGAGPLTLGRFEGAQHAPLGRAALVATAQPAGRGRLPHPATCHVPARIGRGVPTWRAAGLTAAAAAEVVALCRTRRATATRVAGVSARHSAHESAAKRARHTMWVTRESRFTAGGAGWRASAGQ